MFDLGAQVHILWFDMRCPLTARAGAVDGDSELQLVTVNTDAGVQVGESRVASSPDASQSGFAHLGVYPGDYGASGASMPLMGQADIWRRLFSFTMHLVEARWWSYCTHALVAPNSFARCLSPDGLSLDRSRLKECAADWELLTLAESMSANFEGWPSSCRPSPGRISLSTS